MKDGGFLLLCALAGIVFALIQEFRWMPKCTANISGNAREQKGTMTSLEAVMFMVRILLAIVVVMGFLIAYGRFLNYHPSANVGFIGFVILAIFYRIFRRVKKGREL